MTLAVSVVCGVLLALGGFFCITGGLGLLRFPDVYTRIHAAGVTDTLGAGMIVLALLLWVALGQDVWTAFGHDGWVPAMLGGGDVLAPLLVTFKLVSILFFMWVSGTTSTHALAKAAWLAGVAPWRRESQEGDPSKD